MCNYRLVSEWHLEVAGSHLVKLITKCAVPQSHLYDCLDFLEDCCSYQEFARKMWIASYQPSANKICIQISKAVTFARKTNYLCFFFYLTFQFCHHSESSL